MKDEIKKACEVLQKGGVILYPTDTEGGARDVNQFVQWFEDQIPTLISFGIKVVLAFRSMGLD